MIFKAKIIIIVALVVLTGCGYDDEMLEGQNYVEEVCAGAWGDYKNVKPDCNNPTLRSE